MTGYTHEEIRTISAWTEKAYGEKMNVVRSVIDELFDRNSRADEGEYCITAKDGSILTWHFSSSPSGRLPDGRRVVISAAIDITDRKRAEKESTKLSQFPSENPHPVLRISADGTALYANAAAEPLLDSQGSGIGKVLPAEWNELNADALGTNSKRQTDVQHDGRIFSFEVVPVSEANYVNWYGRDVTERRQAEGQTRRQSAVMNAINQVFRRAIVCETEEELGKTCLAVCEELTQSKFGLVLELNSAGLLDTTAISNPGWDACKMPGTDATRVVKNMSIRGIDRSTVREGTSRIVNDPSSHPDRVGTPEGHPEITSFLGVPLKEGGKTIGMIGLGNKELGYDAADQEAVETVAPAVVEALKRKRAEVKFRETSADLAKAKLFFNTDPTSRGGFFLT